MSYYDHLILVVVVMMMMMMMMMMMTMITKSYVASETALPARGVQQWAWRAHCCGEGSTAAAPAAITLAVWS